MPRFWKRLLFGVNTGSQRFKAPLGRLFKLYATLVPSQRVDKKDKAGAGDGRWKREKGWMDRKHEGHGKDVGEAAGVYILPKNISDGWSWLGGWIGFNGFGSDHPVGWGANKLLTSVFYVNAYIIFVIFSPHGTFLLQFFSTQKARKSRQNRFHDKTW